MAFRTYYNYFKYLIILFSGRGRVLQVGAEHLERALVHEHRGVHVGRQDGVDPDVVRAEFHRQRPHQPDDAVLGRDVVAHARHRFRAADGAGEHDRAAPAARDQVRDGRPGGVPRAGQVDVDGVMPVVHAHVLHRAADARDARVGHHDVQPAELGDAGVHRRLDRVEVAHVRLGRDDPAVLRLHQLDRLGEVVGRGHRQRALDVVADVDRDDVGALGGQLHRVTAALAAAGAGDEGDLALESSWHALLPRFFVDVVGVAGAGVAGAGVRGARVRGAGGRADGGQDALVAGAAAQVAGQPLADLLVRGAGIVAQERGHRGDEAGGAESALQPVVLAERLLDGGQRAVGRGDALDGGDLAAVGLHREDQAGAHRLPVEQDGARAADAVLAAQVGAGELAALAQEVGQGQPGLDRRPPQPPVDGDLDARCQSLAAASLTACSQARATMAAPTFFR